MVRETIALVLVVGALSACVDTHETAVESLRCIWNTRYSQCFCTASVYNRGFMAWAPPEVCGKLPAKKCHPAP